MLVFVGLLAALIATIYIYLTWSFDYWKRRGVFGPKPYPYVGTYPKTFLYRTHNLIQETKEIYLKYYRKHRFIGVFESGDPKLLILDPALIADIFIKHFKHFNTNSIRDKIDFGNDPLLKFNPFLQESNDWKETRNELAPAFTALKVKTAYPIIENACQRLVDFLNRRIEAGESSFATQDISTRAIGSIIFDIGFGIDADTFAPNSEFLERSNNQLSSSPYEELWNLLYTIFPFMQKVVRPRFTSKEFTTWFIDIFNHAVKLRESQESPRDDYLNFLIDLKKKKNTPDHVLQSHAYTYFLDAFSTSSHVFSTVLGNLSTYTRCQEKLRTEVKSHGNKKITFDELHEMLYLECFMNETTRLEPFITPIWKTCTESIELEDYDGHTIKVEKGMKVTLPMDALHRHPDYYPNAEEFEPERFDRNSDNAKKLKEAGVFMPFGNGARSCLGKRYAVTSMKAIICTLVNNFEISTKALDTSTILTGGLFFQTGAKTMLEFKKLK